jgi:hypothetical protein
VGIYELPQREVGHHIPIITEDGFIAVQEVFNVLQPACCVQQDWFMAKGYGYPPPSSFGKLFQIDFRQIMGVYDEAIHADAQEMVHRIGDDGTPSNLKEWLRALFCQG